MSKKLTHATALSILVNHLYRVGEDVSNIESVIKEPIWISDTNMHVMCDVIILYKNHYATACELKHSRKQRGKAMKQIDAGRTYIEQVLEYDYKHGLFVTYFEDMYHWERI